MNVLDDFDDFLSNIWRFDASPIWQLGAHNLAIARYYYKLYSNYYKQNDKEHMLSVESRGQSLWWQSNPLPSSNHFNWLCRNHRKYTHLNTEQFISSSFVYLLRKYMMHGFWSWIYVSLFGDDQKSFFKIIAAQKSRQIISKIFEISILPRHTVSNNKRCCNCNENKNIFNRIL